MQRNYCLINKYLFHFFFSLLSTRKSNWHSLSLNASMVAMRIDNSENIRHHFHLHRHETSHHSSEFTNPWAGSTKWSTSVLAIFTTGWVATKTDSHCVHSCGGQIKCKKGQKKPFYDRHILMIFSVRDWTWFVE